MSIGNVIRNRRIELGLSQEDLAKRMGYKSKSTINKIEAGVNDINQSTLVRFSEILGLQIIDFFDDIPKNNRFYKPERATITIPFISQKISAGYGENELSSDDLEVRSIDILSSMCRGYERNSILAATVKGDSMQDIGIFNDDIVVFCKGIIEGNGIYVLSINGEVLVKRLEFNPFTKKLKIISENKKYEPYEVSAEMDGLYIHGKVVGWIHAE